MTPIFSYSHPASIVLVNYARSVGKRYLAKAWCGYGQKGFDLRLCHSGGAQGAPSLNTERVTSFLYA